MLPKRAFLVLAQIETHKDEITRKDHQLVREHFDHHKVEKEKEAIRTEALRVKRQIRSCEEILEAQGVEGQKLVAVMRRAEEERARQSKEYQAAVAERDALRAQVIQRDAELTALYEKLKIQRSTLEKGAAMFKTTKDEEAAIVASINRLRTELQVSKLQVRSPLLPL